MLKGQPEINEIGSCEILLWAGSGSHENSIRPFMRTSFCAKVSADLQESIL
jgi:hypothetical protein